jgi:hypothetical protein
MPCVPLLLVSVPPNSAHINQDATKLLGCNDISWHRLGQQKTRNALQHAGFETLWGFVKYYLGG